MTIGFVREKLIGVPDKANLAFSLFGFAGIVTAKQVRDAISGRPDDDHIQLRPAGGNPKIVVCRADELPKFSAG